MQVKFENKQNSSVVIAVRAVVDCFWVGAWQEGTL